MPRIFLIYPSDSACVFERLIQPARFCDPDWRNVGCNINVGEGVPDDHEWLGFTGLPSMQGFNAICGVKRHGVKLLWSVDDDFTTIPPWNPALRSDSEMLYYRLMKSEADVILTSTPYLASTLSDVSHKVVTAPNLTDVTRFPKSPMFDEEGGRVRAAFQVKLPIRVMWVGSQTHLGDIQILEGVINRVFKAFTPKEVQFVFCGMLPPGRLLRDHLHKGVLYQQPIPFGDYRQAINNMRPDVWLAPLAEIEFNRSKSNLRVMEGWGLNSAVIATPHGEYNCIRDGVDGLLARTEDEWFRAISRVINDHQFRLELACEGRRRLEMDFDWNRRQCRGQWDAVWSRVFDRDPPPFDM